jgi:riboflavin synthase
LRLDDVTRIGDDVRHDPAEGGLEVFTGIARSSGRCWSVQEQGDFQPAHGPRPARGSDAGHGDSIAVNGVCLTVVTHDEQSFTADVMAESLRRSSLGAVRAGSPVNLERAVRVSDRLGGHLVQGHVDGTGEVLSVTRRSTGTVVRGRPAGAARPLRRREGLHHRRRRDA